MITIVQDSYENGWDEVIC